MVIIIVVISIAPCLTDKGEQTALYKINNNVYIKTSKILNYIVIILHYTHTHACTHARTHTCVRACVCETEIYIWGDRRKGVS